MVQIRVIGRDGQVRIEECAEAQSLMRALKMLGYDILAICDGRESCGTCHVYVPRDSFERLPLPTEQETELLEDSEYYLPGQSRLSCQIPVTPVIKGMPVTLAPED